MAWGKVDDNLAFHPKVALAGNEAMGLWVRAMSYCCQQLTDGVIPTVIVSAMDGQTAADRLVEVGLWHEVEVGFEFNDWGEYQPSASEVRRKREELSKTRAQVGSLGGKSTANRRANQHQTDKQKSTPVPEPVPEPLTLSKESVKRAHRIDPNFNVSAEMREWASREVPGLNIDKVTASFIDYWSAKAGKDAMKLDWVATWRNWLRRDHESLPVTSKPTATKTASDASYFCKSHGWPKDECPRCAEVAA